MKATVRVILSLAVAGALAVAAKSLAAKDLPAAVQKTVQEQAKGAEIKNISKETEKGVTQYEVETILNGKHRDFNVDTKRRPGGSGGRDRHRQHPRGSESGSSEESGRW